jgi:peptide/nickel transport system substrate-binding protein
MKVILAILTVTVVVPVALLVLSACGPSPEPQVIEKVVTHEVEVTKILEGAGEVVTVVETRLVEVPVEVTVLPPTPEPEAQRDTLVICLGQEPDTLYLVTSNMSDQREVYNAYNDRASAPDTAYWFYSDLLEKLPTLEDGDTVLIGEEGPEGQLQMTYRVKEGITWHDGEPLTAEDFQYAWEVMMDPKSGVTSRGVWEKAESMEVVDDHTLVVTLKKGIMDPTYGPYYIPEPLPMHALEHLTPEEIVDSEYSRTGYPGTGPFVFEEWVAGEHISFTRNEDYWREGPKFERVVYRFSPDVNASLAALIAGECDVAGVQVDKLPLLQQAREKGLVDYSAGGGGVWEHYDLNQWPWDGRPPWFAKKEVRQALAYGTNRQQMTAEILHGETEPMRSWIPAESWAFNPEVRQYPYDPDRARELLASVGFEDRDGDGVVEAYGYAGTFPDGAEWSIPNGTPFEVSFNTTSGGGLRGTLSQIFQSNMADIGIKVSLDLMPASVLFGDDGPLSQRRFDIAEFAWVSGPDPGGDWLWLGVDILDEEGNVLLAEQIPSEEDGWIGQNYDGWVHEEASYLIFDATNTIKQSDRIPLYHRQQEIFMEEVPTLPLFEWVGAAAFAPDLKGWDLGPANDLTWNIHEWYLEID